MTRFFELRENRAATARHKGDFNAAHTWFLPTIECIECGETWGESGHHYPSVDLTSLRERTRFVSPAPVSVATFNELRELVRPLAPPHAELPPGTHLGPLSGTARGDLGPVTWQGNFLLLLRHDTLEQLQSSGVRGLSAHRTELRWRQGAPPEYLELQIEPKGRLHVDCAPRNFASPCPSCGWLPLSRPDSPVLDEESIPTDVDLFRVGNFATMLIGTERFAQAVRELGLDGILLREVPAR
ncbi:hypothetical protein MFU01_05470 [Myxococcus fulvus]|uniref:Uncharacterized protein n=1 Tax=Myxococcus fulvus TaxID=33 RepID=A0A511SUB5_MYXFU|nr:double-CXXCG motif protein [Myxococcus fulvus]GEN05510.1 hypothetical protein MFU01_05470 [Myxococcus fulvus]